MDKEQLKKYVVYNETLNINQNDVRIELDYEKLLLWSEMVKNDIQHMTNKMAYYELKLINSSQKSAYKRISKAKLLQQQLLGTIKSQIKFLEYKKDRTSKLGEKFMLIAKNHLDNELFILIKEKAQKRMINEE